MKKIIYFRGKEQENMKKVFGGNDLKIKPLQEMELD